MHIEAGGATGSDTLDGRNGKLAACPTKSEAGMEQLFQHGLSNAAAAALLAIVAAIATRIWRNPHFAYAAWLIVLVRLVAPPLVAVNVPAARGINSCELWLKFGFPSRGVADIGAAHERGTHGQPRGSAHGHADRTRRPRAGQLPGLISRNPASRRPTSDGHSRSSADHRWRTRNQLCRMEAIRTGAAANRTDAG